MTGKDHSIFEDILEITTRLPGWLGKVFSHHSPAQQLQSIHELRDEEFSRLVRMIFTRRAFNITEAPETLQGNIDLVLEKDEQKILVAYRHWREPYIDIETITRLGNCMDENAIDNGIILSAGDYSSETRQLAVGNNILLINGDDLARMLNDLLTDVDHSDPEPEEKDHNLKTYTDPVCPECGSPMIKRVAHRGKFAGRSFWGCSQYPDCKGIISGS